jgi:glutathione S-transferase
MELALYYAPNTCALAPYITLTEARADFDVRPLDFRKRQNFSPEYLKINPKHKVPALVVDGKILTENVAIHQWVHRTMGPSDLPRREDPARRSVGPVAGNLAARLVC